MFSNSIAIEMSVFDKCRMSLFDNVKLAKATVNPNSHVPYHEAKTPALSYVEHDVKVKLGPLLYTKPKFVASVTIQPAFECKHYREANV